MTTPPIEITQCKTLREFSCSDNPLDIFDAFAAWQGMSVRVNRRWFGQGPNKYGDWLNSRVVYQGRELDYGDDPRILAANGKVCITSNIYSPGYGFRNHLIEVESDGSWSRYYLMPPAGLEPGKNWSPFSMPDGRLAFIHSFSPLRILREIRREGGIILLSSHEADGIPAEPGDGHGFPAHRGGTNGVNVGDKVIGIGHTTKLAFDANGNHVKSPGCYYHSDNQLIHRPFFWMLDPLAHSVETWPLQYPWDDQKWVIDPTSMILEADGKTLRFFTTEVERSFVDPTSRGATVQYNARLIIS